MIKLPPLPEPDMSYVIDGPAKYNAQQMRDYAAAGYRAGLEAAAYVLAVHQIPVGNSRAGEMACEWTYDALKDCRDAIRALEISHD